LGSGKYKVTSLFIKAGANQCLRVHADEYIVLVRTVRGVEYETISMMNPGDSTDTSISLRDIAKKAEVSLATVSRAMRDDPSTTEETRNKVKAVAKSLGYRPNPAMSSFIEQRWKGRRKVGGLNLAFIYSSQTPVRSLKNLYTRVKQEAEALGYILLDKDIKEFKDSNKLIQQLRAQGVAGLVLAQMPVVPFKLDPVLQNFAAVSIGVSAYQPRCPVVMHDEFLSITKTWLRLEQHGYKRIGAILPYYTNSIAFDFRFGAILCRQSHVKTPSDRIPILFLEPEQEVTQQKINEWLDAHSPDVVLSQLPVYTALKNPGYKLPKNIPFAVFNIWDANDRGKIAGYFRENLELFKRGMQLLDTMIRAGTVGTQHAKLIELVDGEWVDGKSLPIHI